MIVTLFAALACSGKGGDKDKDPDPDPGPSFWLVGDDGLMVQINQAGEASGYPIEITADLLAIACHGSETAWVAGEAGTVLHSRDAGQSWDPVELDVVANWQALAVAEHTPEGAEAVWLVGEGGAVAYTPDGGESWIAVAGASVDFTSVATEAEGNSAIAVASGDTILMQSIRASHSGAEAAPVSEVSAVSLDPLGVPQAHDNDTTNDSVRRRDCTGRW